MSAEGIGASVLRKEDKRFITGKGKYTDDHPDVIFRFQPCNQQIIFSRSDAI